MADDYIAKTIDAYNANPEQYESSTSSLTPHELTEFIQQLPAPEKPVLDIGCGFGRDTAPMAAAGVRIIGLDMSEKLLERAHVLYPEIDFRQMDMRKLSFEDNSVRGIWCHAALLHLNDTDMGRALSEFNRVLAPQGILAVSVKEGDGEETIIDNFSSDGERYYNYLTQETLKTKLVAAGFTVTKCYSFNERDRFGPNMRDLNWVWAFARKG